MVRLNQRALQRCAPFSDHVAADRPMRLAIKRAMRGKRAAQFAQQQAFDRGVAGLVTKIPFAPEVAEWFANENLIPSGRRPWRKIIRNPAVLAIAVALAVIATIFGYRVHERMNDFPGADSARKLLTVAASSRSVLLDPVRTQAGNLTDLFFMKNRLEHYDVPPEFAELKTLGCRVFDDDEGRHVAQIWLQEKRMQLFLFPAEKNPKGERASDFSDWRFVEQEGWSGAVQQRNGVCFMAAVRGSERELLTYVGRPSPAKP